jgi:hypothetical protein
MLREGEELEARQAAAGELLRVAQIIAVGQAPDDTFLMLHPSTVIPEGWQVSMFDRRGPFSHTEDADQAQAIEHALDGYSADVVRPVSEREFMAISATPEFRQGVQAVVFNALDNKIRHEFGRGPDVMAIVYAARGAANYDDAIRILQAGLESLSGP